MPISATLTEADLAAILDRIAGIKAALPFLQGLDVDDLAGLPKLGDKSLAFAQRTLALAQQDDSFLPRNLDIEEFARDVALFETLGPIVQHLTQLLELVKDTRAIAGSDAYLAGLDVYHAAKRTGRGAGLDGLLTAVAERFARRRPAAEPK